MRASARSGSLGIHQEKDEVHITRDDPLNRDDPLDLRLDCVSAL